MNRNDLDARIIAEARRWLGTPYRHQASLAGVGCDCLGLVRGVWRAVHGCEPVMVPPYCPDWGDFTGREPMLEAARSWFEPALGPEAACLVLFRWRPGLPAKHAGIMTCHDRFIHAQERSGVTETRMGAAWRGRIAACFRYPESVRTPDGQPWQP